MTNTSVRRSDLLNFKSWKSGSKSGQKTDERGFIIRTGNYCRFKLFRMLFGKKVCPDFGADWFQLFVVDMFSFQSFAGDFFSITFSFMIIVELLKLLTEANIKDFEAIKTLRFT